MNRRAFNSWAIFFLALLCVGAFARSASGQFSSPPPNDNLNSAEAIVELKTVSRTLSGATTEPNEPEPDRPSVWFSWTTAETGISRLRLSRSQSVAGWSVHVLAGRNWDQEIARASAPTGTVVQLEFDTAIGGNYLVGVKSDPSAAAFFTLSITGGLRVPNDNFADRIVLSGTNLTVEVDLEMATKEIGERGVLDLIASRSAWYEWTPPHAGELTLQYQPIGKLTNRSTGAGLYAGWTTPIDLPSFWPIRSDWADFMTPHQRGWNVEPWTNYAIAVDTESWGLGAAGPMEVRLQLRLAPCPENDLFSSRLRIEGKRATFHGTLDAARADLLGTQRTVWYEWKAPVSGLVSVAVIEGSLVNVAAFERSTSETLLLLPPGLYSSTNFFEAQAGQDYIFGFHAPSNRVGRPFQARLDMAGPANDNFADRIILNGTHATFPIVSFRASTETNEPANLRHSTWWSWTAPHSGWATLRSQSDSFSVFTGTNLHELQAVPLERLNKTEWNLPTSITGFDCTAGVTYQIAAHSISQSPRDSEGELDFTGLRFTSPAEGASVRAREKVRIQMAPIDSAIDGVLDQAVVFIRSSTVHGDAIVHGAGAPPVFLTSFVDTGYYDRYGPRSYYAFATNAAGVLKISKPLRINLVLENDHFAEASPIVEPWWRRITFARATLEPGEVELHGHSGLVSRWWRLDPPRDIEVEFSISEDPGTLLLGVYRGTNFGSLETITNRLNNEWRSSVRFQAQAGSRYYIVLAAERDKGLTARVRTSQKSLHIQAETRRVYLQYANGFGGDFVRVEKSADLRNWETVSQSSSDFSFEFSETNGPVYFFRALSP